MAGDPPVWLIGCGNMAGAMLKGWLAAGEPPKRFRVVDPARPSLPEGVEPVALPANGFDAAIVQLGVKPQIFGQLAPQLAPLVGRRTVVSSIMAGVELATIRARLPDAGAIVRIMPNLPVALRKGAIGLAAEQRERTASVEALVVGLGTAIWLDDESLIDAVTALSGSGPAFVYRFIDALAQGGERLGLDADQALRLAAATVDGASALAASSEENPAALAERVASPGGTTRAGLDVLDRDGALVKLVGETLAAAAQRGRELADEAKG